MLRERSAAADDALRVEPHRHPLEVLVHDGPHAEKGSSSIGRMIGSGLSAVRVATAKWCHASGAVASESFLTEHAFRAQSGCMAEPDDGDLETASRDLARAIWQTVLLARDEHKARGLMGQATRKRLVEKILKLVRVVRRR